MPVLATTLPARRPDLVIRPLGDRGRYVVMDPRTGAFSIFGEQKQFLLLQLDGRRDAETVRTAFEERFGEPLSEEDLGQFLELVRGMSLLQPAAPRAKARPRPAADDAPESLRPAVLA